MVALPFARQASEDNTLLFFGIKVSVLVDGDDTDGQYCLLQHEERKGFEPPLHIHTREDEAFYVLEGEVIYHVDDEVIHAKPGTYVFAPRGIQHSFALKTDQAKVLVFAYPSGFEKYIKEIGVPLPEQLPPIPNGPPTPEEVEKITAVAAKHGIELIL